jgi:imidazolonepropionase-like amidohydrolase
MEKLIPTIYLFALIAGLAQPGRVMAQPGQASGPAQATATWRHWALTGVTIIDASRPQPVTGQTVLIGDGSIEAIFADGSRPLADSIVTIRMKGKFLLPGLIDTHVHMATDPSGVDKREVSLAVLQRMLYSGITSVRDMAGDARVLAGLSRDARVGEIPSPDIYFSALMAGPSFFDDPRTIASARGGISGRMPYMRAVTDTTDLRLAIAEAKGTGATGIKLYANLDAALTARIVAEANKQGLLVWGHAWLDPARPSDLVKAGVGSISHSPLLVYEKMNSVPASWKKPGLPERFWRDSLPDESALFALMKEKGTILDATLSAYRQWGQKDPAMQYSYEIAKRMTAAAYRAGVTICAGTDDDQEGFVQSEMVLMVRDAGMSPRDAIIAATLHGAEALRIAGSCGTIEPGKKADLLLLDTNPLEEIEHIRAVALVVKNGKICWRE